MIPACDQRLASGEMTRAMRPMTEPTLDLIVQRALLSNDVAYEVLPCDPDMARRGWYSPPAQWRSRSVRRTRPYRPTVSRAARAPTRESQQSLQGDGPSPDMNAHPMRHYRTFDDWRTGSR